jgi:hypothetical protein
LAAPESLFKDGAELLERAAGVLDGSQMSDAPALPQP